MAILNPGDKILVPTPVWALYFQLIKLTGAIPVQIDTSKDGFVLTPEHLEKVLLNEGKGVLQWLQLGHYQLLTLLKMHLFYRC